MGFRDAFTEENEKELAIGPKAWQKYINFNAPNGFHYEYIGESQYQLIPDKKDGQLKFRITVTIPDDLKHIKLRDATDFHKLIYRAQRELEITPTDIRANQQPITINQLIVGFSKEIKHEYDKYFIVPQPFEPPVDLPIQMNGNKYQFSIQQMPYPSLTKVIFESSDENIIHIKLTFHEDLEKIDISMNYNFLKANNLADIYNNRQMLRDYATGNINLFGNDFEIFTTDIQIEINQMLDFYLNLYEIKDLFNGEFDINNDITYLDVINLKRMYHSFIEDKYYFDTNKIKNYKMVINSDFSFPLDLSPDVNFAMIGYTKEKIILLGQSLDLTEQFVFKNSSYSSENNPILHEGESIIFNINDDQIAYRKLMHTVPSETDMNEIIIRLKEAAFIDVDSI